MSFTLRFEFSLGVTRDDTSTPTVGELRSWLAAVEAAGVGDDEELLIEYTEQEDPVGFYVYGHPSKA